MNGATCVGTRRVTGLDSARLRHLTWRAAFGLSGGLVRDGRLPAGGCVIVANHSSHADTPALLAALDAAHTPHVAAAADYWFSSSLRARFCRIAVAGFPVRRTGGGYGDLCAAAGTLLADGRAVVVFASGSRDCGIDSAHAGAFHLAAEHRVPVVPVGLAGTAAMLPKSGRMHRGRVTVRIGSPVSVDPDDIGSARREVVRAVGELSARSPASPAAGDGPRESRLRDRIAAAAIRRRAAVLLFVAALAEAVSWPLLPEATLALLLSAAPTHGWRVGVRLVGVAAVGSVLGGLLTAWWAARGVLPPQPLTTTAMRASVHNLYLSRGIDGIWYQPLSGIPFKVFARAAGQNHLDLLAWAGQALLARASRMVAVAGLALMASRVVRWRPRLYPPLVGVTTAVFVASGFMVVQSWR